MLVYLPVNKETGKVDYSYIGYLLDEIPVGSETFELLPEWEYKPFTIMPFEPECEVTE